jgi:hypothetical protein
LDPSLWFNQSVQNKSMENVTAVGDKDPPQMGQAHGAITDAPGIAGKPGKFE